MRRTWIAVAAAALLGLPVPLPAEAAPKAFDYSRIKGLSTERYDETVRDVVEVPMRDGVKLHIEIVRPDAPGRFGTIMRVSPYHGPIGEDREGRGLVPGFAGSLVQYFVPRGYAVAFADLRGTGLSQGCMDYMGPTDKQDLYEIVEWVAARRWSNGRVGMIGVSYPGSTPVVAAAARPPHLTTIVPIAGLSRMYDHQFQQGVPYYLQWLGPAAFYETFSVTRFVEDPQGTAGSVGSAPGCGAPNSAVGNGEPIASGAETAWHRARDHGAAAAKNPLPVFLVHGVFDGSVRMPAADWFHTRRRSTDKVWIGQWGHQDPPRGEQWMYALHAWFDRHLQGRKVATGPRAELFLNDGRVYGTAAWPPPARQRAFHAASDGRLGAATGEEETDTYVADAAGHEREFDTGHLAYRTEPFARDTLLAGVPLLRMKVAVSSPRIHLLANLYDVNAAGTRRRIGQATFAVQPELRDGIDKPKLVTPMQVMTINLRGMLLAHTVLRGHRVELRFASSHPDKVPTFGSGSLVNLQVGGDGATRLLLPVVERPRLLADSYEPE